MQSDLKICRTPELGVVAANGRERSYNRQIPEGLVEVLDPDGVHVVEPIMSHHHAGGDQVPRHLRCRVYLKVPNKIEPLLTFADFDVEDVERMAAVSPEAHPEGAM